MEFIIDNWFFIILIIAAVVIIAVAIKNFFNRPTEEQLAKVKEWLLWAVTQAERIFGGQTGQIKLRYVYDLFVTRFPAVSKLITFEMFSQLVDEALEKFRNLLESNVAIKEYVENKEAE